MPVASELPNSVDALKAIIVKRDTELHAMTLMIEKLKAQLARMRRDRFGASSESLDQLELLIETMETERAERTAQSGSSPTEEPKVQPKRKALPEHLPRKDIVHEPAADCTHCGRQLRKLGEDVREQLDYVPGRFVVIRHIRPKLSCRHCGTIVQAPMPSMPIERR